MEESVMFQTKEGPQLRKRTSVCMPPVRVLRSVHLNLLNLITQLMKYLHAKFIC
jgi:hypothetical protein